MSSRIKIAFPKDEPTPSNVFPDLNWVSDNRVALHKKYGDAVIVVYQKEIIGIGQDYDEALADAESKLDPDIDLITPAIGSVFNPNESYFYIKQLMREHFARKRQNNSAE
jgi:hypothetical protein